MIKAGLLPPNLDICPVVCFNCEGWYYEGEHNEVGLEHWSIASWLCDRSPETSLHWGPDSRDHPDHDGDHHHHEIIDDEDYHHPDNYHHDLDDDDHADHGDDFQKVR